MPRINIPSAPMHKRLVVGHPVSTCTLDLSFRANVSEVAQSKGSMNNAGAKAVAWPGTSLQRALRRYQPTVDDCDITSSFCCPRSWSLSQGRKVDFFALLLLLLFSEKIGSISLGTRDIRRIAQTFFVLWSAVLPLTLLEVPVTRLNFNTNGKSFPRSCLHHSLISLFFAFVAPRSPQLTAHAGRLLSLQQRRQRTLTPFLP